MAVIHSINLDQVYAIYDNDAVHFSDTTGGTLSGPLRLHKMLGTANVTYVTATSFNTNPPAGTTGQILFVIQGV